MGCRALPQPLAVGLATLDKPRLFHHHDLGLTPSGPFEQQNMTLKTTEKQREMVQTTDAWLSPAKLTQLYGSIPIALAFFSLGSRVSVINKNKQ